MIAATIEVYGAHGFFLKRPSFPGFLGLKFELVKFHDFLGFP